MTADDPPIDPADDPAIDPALDRTRTARGIAGAGAALYVVAFVQPWLRSVPGSGVAAVIRGQDALVFGVVPLVLLVSTGIVLALPVLPFDGPDRLGPVSGPGTAAVASLAAALLVVLRATLPADTVVGGVVVVLHREPWLFIAAAAAVTVATAAGVVHADHRTAG